MKSVPTLCGVLLCMFISACITIPKHGVSPGAIPRDGTLTFDDGSSYRGQIADGMMHGKGVLTFADGTRYTGDFEGGMMHGEGVLHYADGARYQGDFRRGKRHGQGSLTRQQENGQYTYTGSFKNDRADGKGTRHGHRGQLSQEGHRLAQGAQIESTIGALGQMLFYPGLFFGRELSVNVSREHILDTLMLRFE